MVLSGKTPHAYVVTSFSDLPPDAAPPFCRGRLVPFDSRTGAIIRVQNFAAKLSSAAVDDTLNRIFVIAQARGTGSIIAINTMTGKLVGEYPTRSITCCIAVAPRNRRFLLLAGGTGRGFDQLEAFDSHTGKQVGPDRPARAFADDDRHGRVYVVDWTTGVGVYAVASLKGMGTWSLDRCGGRMWKVAVSSRQNRVYVGSLGEVVDPRNQDANVPGYLCTLNMANGKVVAAQSMGKGENASIGVVDEPQRFVVAFPTGVGSGAAYILDALTGRPVSIPTDITSLLSVDAKTGWLFGVESPSALTNAIRVWNIRKGTSHRLDAILPNLSSRMLMEGNDRRVLVASQYYQRVSMVCADQHC